MRIVSWNCAGAYRDKIHKILELKPDIAVIQECECLDALRESRKDKIPQKSLWFSDIDHNKGVGIFFYDDSEILSIEYYSRIEFIVPLRIKSKFEFYFFAIWAMQGRGEGVAYTGQIERAVNKFYKNILMKHPSVLIGDYNSPNIELPVDKPRINYSLVDSLKELNIVSAYHEHFKVEYGEHKHHTFYQHRKRDFKHMLDYCFTSRPLIEKIIKVEVGDYDDWIEFSDHCPLIVDFDFT
ncbi:endonuclease/exonuclease/phosphatase family protein [Acidobacteriota bacterium]